MRMAIFAADISSFYCVLRLRVVIFQILVENLFCAIDACWIPPKINLALYLDEHPHRIVLGERNSELHGTFRPPCLPQHGELVVIRI